MTLLWRTEKRENTIPATVHPQPIVSIVHHLAVTPTVWPAPSSAPTTGLKTTPEPLLLQDPRVVVIGIAREQGLNLMMTPTAKNQLG